MIEPSGSKPGGANQSGKNLSGKNKKSTKEANEILCLEVEDDDDDDMTFARTLFNGS